MEWCGHQQITIYSATFVMTVIKNGWFDADDPEPVERFGKVARDGAFATLLPVYQAGGG
jgi:hypothetical protein